ncbi:MAG: prepilin-type N-terminal cleavage/methylation domain-containing protein [Dethiobacter sp.]|jgi:Tfp pilus assembly protein PilV|nr:prepilin-type N-terminal cleavage/methylation domain-containing protein [Dethiobacter sp.]MCL4464051.1 prepilin-type N-terminal cleavage/methylation domain-containing protein [Bacillota bacterium]MCL5993065.1 prepilin-type N-terminal cleavage/methylation domain-containing protein [Bacillota bacterium]
MAVKRECGFLLLELVVALAVLLVVVVPMLGLLGMAAEAQGRARRHTAAAFLARETMETVRSRGYHRAESVAAEQLTRGGDFLRTVKVSAVAPRITGLKKVVVRVSWQERKNWHQVELVTYLAGGETMGRRGLR